MLARAYGSSCCIGPINANNGHHMAAAAVLIFVDLHFWGRNLFGSNWCLSMYFMVDHLLWNFCRGTFCEWVGLARADPPSQALQSDVMALVDWTTLKNDSP
jgi:hypothetical protein